MGFRKSIESTCFEQCRSIAFWYDCKRGTSTNHRGNYVCIYIYIHIYSIHKYVHVTYIHKYGNISMDISFWWFLCRLWFFFVGPKQSRLAWPVFVAPSAPRSISHPDDIGIPLEIPEIPSILVLICNTFLPRILMSCYVYILICIPIITRSH